MNRTSIIFITLFSLFLSACTAESTDSPSSTIDINISDYFPELGTERRYIEFDDLDFITDDIVKQEPSQTGEKTTYIQEFDELGETVKVTEYKISKDEIKVIYIITPVFNQEVNHIELTNKKQWNVGNIDNSTRRLTDTDLEMSVHAGVFTDVIEITEEVPIERYENIQLINYYAPKIGLIQSILKNETETIVFRELYSYTYEGITHPNEYVDESLHTDESDGFSNNDAEESYDDDEYIDESPIPVFRSGKLPPVTNKVSNLNINDYQNRVNNHTIDQGQGPILHRPDSIERPNGEFSLRYLDGIHIQVDSEGNLIDITMTDDYLGGQDLFLYFNWLLHGLDENISNDEINEIIFPNDENVNQYFQVGQFNVGIEDINDRISLRVVVR